MSARAAVTLLAGSCVLAAAQQPPTYTSPRILRAELPPLPSPIVVGGGEVVIEGVVDRNGFLTRPVLLRSTPPFAEMLLDVIKRWRFAPAREARSNEAELVVEAPVLIAAVYRPPTFYNGPSPGQPAKNLFMPSADVAYPTLIVTPTYPPKGFEPGVVLFEVLVDQTGLIRDARPVAADSGFGPAARDALMQWKFRAPVLRGGGLASAYVLFGFRPPVVVLPGAVSSER